MVRFLSYMNLNVYIQVCINMHTYYVLLGICKYIMLIDLLLFTLPAVTVLLNLNLLCCEFP